MEFGTSFFVWFSSTSDWSSEISVRTTWPTLHMLKTFVMTSSLPSPMTTRHSNSKLMISSNVTSLWAQVLVSNNLHCHQFIDQVSRYCYFLFSFRQLLIILTDYCGCSAWMYRPRWCLYYSQVFSISWSSHGACWAIGEDYHQTFTFQWQWELAEPSLFDGYSHREV